MDMNETMGTRSLRYDSVDDALVNHEKHSLQAYVSDMLALERHVREPIVRQSQLDVTAGFPKAMEVIARMEMLTDVHIEALKSQLSQLGGENTSPVKSAISSLLGAGAAAVDNLRSSKVSKNLRDDYAALSLTAINYTMLHTVALGFGDRSTADLATRHLSDTAALIVEISKILPGVVLQELAAEGVEISAETRHNALINTHDAWSDSGT